MLERIAKLFHQLQVLLSTETKEFIWSQNCLAQRESIIGPQIVTYVGSNSQSLFDHTLIKLNGR